MRKLTSCDAIATLVLIIASLPALAQIKQAKPPRAMEPRPSLANIPADATIIIRGRFDPLGLTPRFQANPPMVRSVGVVPGRQEGANKNALLVVEFEANEQLPARIPISTEQGNIELRDDGKDGDERARDLVYSAPIEVDVARIRAAGEKFAAMLKSGVKPVFFPNRGGPMLPPSDFLRVPEELRNRALPFPPLPPPPPPDPAKVLMITDLSVIEDPTRTFNPCTNTGVPMGQWTFGHLMEHMANMPLTGIDPSQFTLRWIRRWASDQVINDWIVANRNSAAFQQLVANWQSASGGPAQPLNLAKAPFRLLAIVNRIDLRENLVYGAGSAGEGRFIFGALGPNCSPLPFTVIFEYGIRRDGCSGLKAWGQQWASLNGMLIGSPQYNAALAAITEQFVKAGADPLKPNQSALNQLRTNEFAFGPPWQLREFHIAAADSDAGHLREVTVKQTPDVSLNKTAPLADYVNQNSLAIKAQQHTVPLDFPPPNGGPFLGGAADTDKGMFWNDGAPALAPIADRLARHMFSLQTCNGCHAGETKTLFTHVSPAPFGVQPQLSAFLTGINSSVPDPADGMPIRNFHDLQDRALGLANLLASSCFVELRRTPLRMTH